MTGFFRFQTISYVRMVSIALLDDLIEKSRLSPLFSVEQVGRDDISFKNIQQELKLSMGCEPIAVVRIHNTIMEESYANIYDAYQQAGFPLNEKILYHSTKSPLDEICAFGFSLKFAKKGLFGAPGVYLADTINKANRYSTSVGDISKIRAMLRCRVILGKTKEYPVGHAAQFLTKAPEGYQSVKGFLTGGHEYVVYSPTQVLISEVFFYRVTSKEVDGICPSFPFGFSGKLVFLHSDLSQLFSYFLMVPRDTEIFFAYVNALIGGEIDIHYFLASFHLSQWPSPMSEADIQKITNAFSAFPPVVVDCLNGVFNKPLPPVLPPRVVSFQLF